jgi:hypothetical protein
MTQPTSSLRCLLFSFVVVVMVCLSNVAWGTLNLGNTTTLISMNCSNALDDNQAQPWVDASHSACYRTTVTGCVDPLGSNTFLPDIGAYLAVSTPAQWNGGTVVLFSGGSGTAWFVTDTDTDPVYAPYYFDAGLQVVLVAWKPTWRDNTNAPEVKSMKYEACRPATLLKMAYQSHSIHRKDDSTGAMCAQGHSTGATAIAFALAWYDADSYLNNVLFTSGPPQANIKAGCQYPAVSPFNNPIEVCAGASPGEPAPMCHVGTNGTWNDCTQYLRGGRSCASPDDPTRLSPASSVAHYTNNPPGNCNDWNRQHDATTSYDSNWFDMSVVSTGADYSYVNTSVHAFLCATGEEENNSAAQSWLYLQHLSAPNLDVYRVDQCGGNEQIWYGYTEDGSPTNKDARSKSEDKMVSGCVLP